jgi:hypothetical protein
MAAVCGCYLDFCVLMCSEKALNPVQTWLPGFPAMRHYTKIGMASNFATGGCKITLGPPYRLTGKGKRRKRALLVYGAGYFAWRHFFMRR